MTSRKLYSLLLFLFCLAESRDACCQLNLNARNGLPVNHVYQVVEDKYGYLWIATANGVARYNGYDLKTYTISDGLPSNDVWSIHLDKKERLWLLCFTNSLGYIYKNRYYETYDDDSFTMSTNRVFEYKDGIVFLTKFRETIGFSLFKEKNDTLTKLKDDRIEMFWTLNDKAEVIIGVNADSIISTYSIIGKELKLKSQCSYNGPVRFAKQTFHSWFTYHNYDVAPVAGTRHLYSVNLATCQLDTIIFQAGVIKNTIHANRFLYVFAGDSVYKLDSNLKTVQTITVNDLTAGYLSLPTDIAYVLENDFWGRIITTRTNGLFILPQKISPFKKIESFNTVGYKHVGRNDANMHYWWNSGSGMMAYVTDRGEITYQRYQINDGIRKILPFKGEQSLLFLNYAPTLFNYRTGKVTDLIKFKIDQGMLGYGYSATDALIINDTVYSIGSSAFNKSYIRNDTLYSRSLHMDRCTGLTYDSIRHLVWAYNTGKIVLHNHNTEKLVTIPDNLFKPLGIDRVELVVLDNKFGNILIKDGDKLLCIDPKNYSRQQLFDQCDLSSANIFTKGNMLIATGKFGVLFCKILGPGKFSEPIVYYNEKYSYYLHAYDAHVSGSKLLMNTDNGLYTIDLPGDAALNNTSTIQPFKLTLTYANDLVDVNNNDSFSFDQNNRTIAFDLIKPSGSGHVRYLYMINGIDSSWQELNSNELILSTLRPGKYYSLLLKLRDDVWKSNPIKLNILIVPYWWQTNPGQVVLWLLSTILLGVVILATVFITRKIITQNNIKKNRLLELEIKSIYSQINPHFIFNTLNTTLHYIVKKKLDEAYDHVSSFSSLLRSYLKSSRNRYITLGEEIANLRNYIHLQQTRFENAFTYEIITDIPNGKTIDIPSLLLQPVVENAINHGLLPKNSPGHLKLAFITDRHTNVVTCIIDDNGVGRKYAGEAAKNTERESYGSQLIAELVDIFNKYENAGIDIKYIDKELPETGTTVIITIKNARTNG
ncbi:MAG: hypothetical protein K0R82_274 [Flavipsychrobacter sp.]|nr:hypothetical protein [Flavipsychrobacter sp.]